MRNVRSHRLEIFRRSTGLLSRWTVISTCTSILQYNDNFNHYVTHKGVKEEQFEEFHASLYSVNTRLEWMYEKAKEDYTFRTDIPRDEFFRVTVHTMMSACVHYVGGFIWGARDNKDYTPELLRIKEMILNYVKTSE